VSTHKGLVLWFTGLSGAGKTTIAKVVVEYLQNAGAKVEYLDGDEMRAHLCKDLGFSKPDRDTNIRRIGYVANLLARNGVITVVAAISPYKQARDEVRANCENFVEVFVDCEMDILVARDTKGLYKKALAGEISNFTGVSDPYEPPENPEIVVLTSTESISQCVDRICEFLEEKNLTAFVSQEDWPRTEVSNA